MIMMLEYAALIFYILGVLQTVLSATPPDLQSLILPLPDDNSQAYGPSTASPLQAVPVTSAPLNEAENATSAGNLTSSNTPILCFGDSSVVPHLPIVLEDCYPIFQTIFLHPSPNTPQRYIPGVNVWVRQNGNCVFKVLSKPGRKAATRFFTEYQFGGVMAKIVQKCVRAETEYFGGLQELVYDSDWYAEVVALRSPP